MPRRSSIWRREDYCRCCATPVPEAVAREVRAYEPHDPTAQALATTSWLTVKSPEPVPEAVTAWNLGAGESSVPALALRHPGCGVIIDDLAGRRCAEALSLPLRGTLGLVLAARRSGRIAAARPLLEQLRDAGMFLADDVIDRVLRQVGE